jgi:transcriptional regulator with XRE-family HTH domain
MMGKRTPDDVRAEVVRRTRAGEKQKQIARAMRLCKGTIAKIERENSLQRHPGFVPTRQQEKQVIKLFRAGFGAPYITTTTHVPGHIVYEIRDRHGLRRAPGTAHARYNFAAPQLRAIRRAIRQSERAIAHEFGVTHSWLRQFRHKMWSNSGEQHWRRKKVTAPQEPISAQQFVEKVFNFELRPGAILADGDVKTAAQMLLQLRTEVYGKPHDEPAYFRELCGCVASRLGVAPTSETGWVH